MGRVEDDHEAVRSSNRGGMTFVRTFALFVVTALAEIVGCYLP